MKECYLKGWNPKEITSYFGMELTMFYKDHSVSKLKGIKRVIAYRKMLEQDAKLPVLVN